MSLKIFIQQPVIPEYRETFFAEIAKFVDYDVELHASLNIFGAPKTQKDSFEFTFIAHQAKSYCGNRIFWQEKMLLPEHFSKGDIVVFNSNPRYFSHFNLIRQAKNRGCKIIAWNHAMSATSGKISSWVRKKLTAWAADLILLYTEKEINMMQKEGFPENRLMALNNSIDTSKHIQACLTFTDETSTNSPINLISSLRENSSKKLLEFKRQNHLENKKILLFCGRITEKCQLDLLFQAMQKMDENILLIIIGDGPQKELLEKEAPSSILWLGSIYHEKELCPWFLSADIFVYPGAIGLSLNHAFAYGLPVVSHNDAEKQMPEFFYLKENENGLTYEAGNSADLAKKLTGLLSNEQKVKTFSKKALETIYEIYSFKNMVKNFKKALKKVQ